MHVIGAAGRLGAALCRRLHAADTPIVAVVRNPARWDALGLPGAVRQADLADPASIRAALVDARRIVAVSHAVWTPTLLGAAPAAARLVLTGTARRYYGARSDPFARAAFDAEALLGGRDGVILHPTMIYGSLDDGTLGRLATLIRRFRLLPLPQGGARLVQPIHVQDVAACLHAALELGWREIHAVALAGPAPLPYAALVRAVADAAGVRRPVIVPVPAPLVRLAGRRHPGLLRWLEDRIAEIGPMRDLLGVMPRPLERGLHEMFDTAVGRTTGLEPATSKTTTWRSTN